MDISRFKADHQVIAKGIADLRLLVQQGLVQNADRIVEHLHQLSAKIKLHLNAEDAVLYPALMRQSASAPAETARQFQSEMGDLAKVYGAFTQKWAYGKLIVDNQDAFKADANTVFQALHERVRRENQELYPLAEQV